MELKDYFYLIKRNKNLFWSIWLGVILIGIGTLIFQPEKYQATMSIDIARTQDENKDYSKDYSKDYDQYYRLEADERFSRQIVAWLKDPATLGSIKEEEKNNFQKLKAEKLAPSFVQIEYQLAIDQNAKQTFVAIQKALDGKVTALDPGTGEWFRLVYYGPVLTPATLPFWPVIFGALILGLLTSIFALLAKEYW